MSSGLLVDSWLFRSPLSTGVVSIGDDICDCRVNKDKENIHINLKWPQRSYCWKFVIMSYRRGETMQSVISQWRGQVC